MLLQPEQQLKTDQEEEQAVAIYAARDASYARKPKQVQQQSQKQKGYSNKPETTAKCFYCDKIGHLQVECRKRLRDVQRNNQKPVAFGASATKTCSNAWSFDSAASRHLTPNKLSLLDYRSVEPGTAVHLVNGQRAAALGQGDVILQVRTSNGTFQGGVEECASCARGHSQPLLNQTSHEHRSTNYIHGPQVLCLPLRHGVPARHQSRRWHDDIHQVNQPPIFAMTAKTAIKETPELWHRRFGLLGYDKLLKLKKNNMEEGILVPAADFKHQQEQKPVCEGCICSKQHRLPFPDSDSNSADLLELVHMDV